MATSKVKYLGNLRTSLVHLKSGVELVTDAPVDNNGKGSSFSPTDLLATSYASCMITIIGIHCNENGIPFDHAEATVTKVMASAPRRVSEIIVDIDLSGNGWSPELVARIQLIGEACPVAKSIRDSIIIKLNYTF